MPTLAAMRATVMAIIHLGGIAWGRKSDMLNSLGAAALLQWVRVSTTNFQTFSELAFRFVFTPGVAGQALAFALVMGLLGGLLPALRAARMPLVEALRGG